MIGDLVGSLIGVGAIGLTTYTIVQTRRQGRLDAFTSMHNLLITQESQRGRRRVYAAADSGSWPERNSPEWDEINRALTMLETGAMYRDKKIGDGELAMECGITRFDASGDYLPSGSWTFCGDDYIIWPYLTPLFRRSGGPSGARRANAAS